MWIHYHRQSYLCPQVISPEWEEAALGTAESAELTPEGLGQHWEGRQSGLRA